MPSVLNRIMYNVAATVTAMMATICINIDVRSDTELMPSNKKGG